MEIPSSFSISENNFKKSYKTILRKVKVWGPVFLPLDLIPNKNKSCCLSPCLRQGWEWGVETTFSNLRVVLLGQGSGTPASYCKKCKLPLCIAVTFLLIGDFCLQGWRPGKFHMHLKKITQKLNKARAEEKHISVEALFKEEFGPSVMYFKCFSFSTQYIKGTWSRLKKLKLDLPAVFWFVSTHRSRCPWALTVCSIPWRRQNTGK